MNLFNSRNLYKLILFVFLSVAVVKIKTQLVALDNYNKEIAVLNDKIALLRDKIDSDDINYVNSKEDNENIARKDLKMYYPNETPYLGY